MNVPNWTRECTSRNSKCHQKATVSRMVLYKHFLTACRRLKVTTVRGTLETLAPVFSTFSSLYREYQIYCGEHGHAAAFDYILRKVLKQINLSLFKLKKYQCDVCVQY